MKHQEAVDALQSFIESKVKEHASKGFKSHLDSFRKGITNSLLDEALQYLSDDQRQSFVGPYLRALSSNSESSLKILPIDDVPVFCPTWCEIKGKAHLYQTARIRATGEYVKLLGISHGSTGPEFRCQKSGGEIFFKSTEELCGFVL